MKTGRTFVEKLLNAPAGAVACREPDFILSQDNSARIRKLFEQMGGEEVRYPGRLVVVLDRKMIGTTDELIRDYNSIHTFMGEQQVEHFFDCDKGICHQVLTGYLKPGLLVVGNDSHTCTAGAFNCLAVGLSKTETAALWKTGRMWFRVPETIRITLKKRLRKGVYAKDLALWISGMLREEDVAYRAIEYHGEGVRSLTIADRMTLANVSAEMGVKSSAFPPDDMLADYFGNYAIQGVWADENAMYAREFEVNLEEVMPLAMITRPEQEVKSVAEWGTLEIQQGLIGGCANGRLEDLRAVAQVLKGNRIAPGFQLSIVPASREIYLQAIQEGLIDIFSKAGASILGASCGPCLGSSHMILADTNRFITTTNSHSMDRLLSVGVEKYVASPATIAATALKGALAAEIEMPEAVYPYWAAPRIPVKVDEFDDRLAARVWNYTDIDHISCEQLLAETRTYHISPGDGEAIKPYLLEGLDTSFAKRVEKGDILMAGKDFGCGKLIKQAIAGLIAAGVKIVLAKSVDRRFYRLSAECGLWVLMMPQLVESYQAGDVVIVDIEDERIYLNGKEYAIPRMESCFLDMIRSQKGFQ